MKIISNTLLALLLIALQALLFSCEHFEKNSSHQQTPDENIANGKKLAAVYCQSCHQLPDPSLLASKDWENGVLPGMGPRLGIFAFGFKEYPSSRYDKELDPNYYPKQPMLSFQDWQYIIDYYTALSPDSLPAQHRDKTVIASTDFFSIKTPAIRQINPAIAFVKIDTTRSAPQLITTDVLNKNIVRYNNLLQPADSFITNSPVVDLDIGEKNMVVCNIGVMPPNNGRHGSTGSISINENGMMKPDSSLNVTGLARPVQCSQADFNQDGKMDLLVCEFGNLTGALSWMENKGNGEYKKHIIRALPGAIKAYVTDVNQDGLPDIWVLFAQGEEGIFLFTNKGNGVFSQAEVLRFPPVYGSSYFELADFNKDGHPDIVYTCGDNADYSPVLKPYHGIYIFMNDGSNHFAKSYFFAMHGCFKAVARDFNGDGNIDIAAISFFADYAHHPEESFIYLESNGGFDFQPYTIPGTAAGRWLTMDAGDLDGDGKPDIVLGNFSIAPTAVPVTQNWKDGPPFMLLKNVMKK